MHKYSLPEISVCMITYGHASFILEAIRGVLNQDIDFNVELVISNDCSPDQTDEIVRDFLISAEIPPRFEIKYVNHDPNLGMAKNFLWAMKQCKGKYIALCEGDDYWNDSLKLKKQWKFLEENHKYILSFHDSFVVESEGLIEKKRYLEDSNKKDLSFEEFSTGKYVLPTHSVFFRNQFIDELPQTFLTVLNTDTFLYMFLSSKGSFHFHPEIFHTAYRKHGDGIWTSKNSFQKSLSGLYTFETLKKIFPSNRNIDSKIHTLRIETIYYCWRQKNWKFLFIHYSKTLFLSFSDKHLANKFFAFHKKILDNRFQKQ